MNAPMKLKLQHVTVRKNKDGTYRHYFRRRGQPLVALPDPFDETFMTEYKRLRDWTAPAAQGSEGTFAWLCDQYMDSAEFKGKAKATREARRRVILAMTRERLHPKFPETFGMERAHKIGRQHIMTLRDRKADAPNAANERLKILSQVFKMAIARGWRDDNPVRDMPRLAIPRGGHDTATDDHIGAYLDFHKKGPPRRAIVLLTAFGVRVSDLRVLGPQHERSGRLVFETVKTGVLCNLPIAPDVAAELNGCRDLVYLTNEYSRPYASDKALSQRVSKWFQQAGVRGITAHSVRKWLATRLAEDGASELELMAWFGWRDAKEARPYVQTANRLKLANRAGERLASVTRLAPVPHMAKDAAKNAASSNT